MKNLALSLLILLSTTCCKTNKSDKNVSEEKKSITELLLKHIEKDGLEKSKQWFYQNKNSNQFSLDKNEMAEAAYTLFSSGKVNEAIEVLKLNVNSFPNSKDVFDDGIITNMAKQLQDQGQLEKSLNLLKLNLKVNPESEKSYRAFGDYYLQEGKNNLAVKNYNKAAELNPKNNLFQIVFKASNKYIPTEIPKDTLSLFKTLGNLKNDTAFIFVQGGPDLKLNIHDKDPLHIMSQAKDLLKVYPLQAAMLNPDMVVSIPTITKEQAAYENNVSSEILYRTITYFKNQGKTVYVIGHSHGAGISLNYINNKEVFADKIVLMGRDLDEDLRSHPKLGKGEFIRWKDGEEPYVTTFFRGIPKDFPVKNKLDAVISNLEMLVKTHSERRYTKLLYNKDISNVIFVHAKFDEANGRVTQNNLDFLKSKNAKTIETYGNHHSMLTQNFMTNLYNHLIKNTLLKQSIAGTLSKIIEEKGIGNAINQVENLKASTSYHPINEQEINLLGYQLIKKENINAAIKVFALNASEFPNSWNVYDSLGETYMMNEQNNLAIKNYEKSLELNPKNNFAKEALKKLKK